MDYLCLYITAKILRRAFSLKRIILASILGGLYGIATLLLPFSSAISLALDILACIVITVISFYKKRQTGQLVIITLLYFGVSMAVGGTMTALFNLLNKLNLPLDTIENDGISVWGFAFLSIAAGAFSLFGGRFIFKKRETSLCTLTIEFDGKRDTFCGLSDSGNLLRDYVSGKPIIIIDRNCASSLVNTHITDAFLRGEKSNDPAYSSMRLSHINTVSGESVIVILKPIKILIEYEYKGKPRQICPDALFALGNINNSREYDAIIPASLFRG